MIVVKLMGGLGNQMFQYAMGRALSLRTDTVLKLDLSWFATSESSGIDRPYDLSNFNIIENISTVDEVKSLKACENRVSRKVRAIANRYVPLSWQSHIQEKYFHFDPAVLSIKHDAYLSGYWQSERYFADFAGVLRNDFTFRKPLVAENKRLAEKMLEYNSVSIHIRRGDYVSVAKNASFYESCSLDYYYKGLAKISERQPDLHVYVFSDDIEWAKQNLDISYPITFINHNQGENAFEDMRLMSLCKHNIIANSSFSWWGAWLNQTPEKIVIAPERWFAQGSNDTRDLLPGSWVKL
jgi:hypothetical protein